MTIADALTFLGIAVSIVFGFFVSHFYSVLDTRTRALKDFHIEEIKSVKRRIDSFFHKIAYGQISPKNVVKWFDHLSMDISSIDKGVRKQLDLHIEDIADHVEHYFFEITSWEDFNNQYNSNRYTPSTEKRIRLVEIKSECDDFLNNFIIHVNQANSYPIWKVQSRRVKENFRYYRSKGKWCPWTRAVGERIEKHFFEIIFILGIAAASIWLIRNIKKEDNVDLATPLQNISNRQDSIHKEMQLLRDKYRPVEIQSKTFKNSSFFNAEKVDSVHIKLYQGSPQ